MWRNAIANGWTSVWVRKCICDENKWKRSTNMLAHSIHLKAIIIIIRKNDDNDQVQSYVRSRGRAVIRDSRILRFRSRSNYGERM